MRSIHIYIYIYTLGHIIVSAEVNKSHDVHLLKRMSYKKCTVLKPIYVQWPYKKVVDNHVFQIPLKNEQGHREIIYHKNTIKIPRVMFKQ